ncbi:MAG: ATP-binding protein [Eubacteriales bacterium]
MIEKRKKSLKMWFYFTLIVIGILVVSLFIMLTLVYIFYGSELKSFNTEASKYLVIPFLLTGILIGTLISVFVSKRFLSPIDRINNAFSKVSKGDFDVRLPSESKIREISQMNRSFNSMVKELSSIETLRSDFITNVSHEFKTPIAAIDGYATLLENPEISEKERAEYTEKILSNSKKLVSLSENILYLSRIENRNFIDETAPYRLDEQIRKELLLLEPVWSKKNITFDISLPKTTYVGNESLLRHVWHNLFTNAIKYSDENGEIKVSLYEKDKKIVVSVSDNGIGMSEEVKKHIFEKFYQGDTAHKSEGNGLGLTIVKRILDIEGGEISAESELGKGSVFTVILPN